MGGPIIMEMEPYQNIERIKSHLLDLKDVATSYRTEVQRIQLLHKRNLQFEVLFRVSVLGFASEMKPKMMTLVKVRRMQGKERDDIYQAIDNITYYENNFKQLDVSKADALLKNLMIIADILGIFSIVRPTGKTFDKSTDLMNSGFNG
jgi:hypothetical protein